MTVTCLPRWRALGLANSSRPRTITRAACTEELVSWPKIFSQRFQGCRSRDAQTQPWHAQAWQRRPRRQGKKPQTRHRARTVRRSKEGQESATKETMFLTVSSTTGCLRPSGAAELLDHCREFHDVAQCSRTQLHAEVFSGKIVHREALMRAV